MFVLPCCRRGRRRRTTSGGHHESPFSTDRPDSVSSPRWVPRPAPRPIAAGLGAAQRTFVASYGLTANTAFNCSLVAPCRSFNAAISVTDPGGEVVILDTAGYGPMTINKSIKIIGPSGVYGGISVLGGVGPPPPPTTGIVINAGDTDVVTLRGPRHLRRARRATAPADRHRHPERRHRAHREVVDRELHAGHERVHQRRLGEADPGLRQRQLPARVPQRHPHRRDRAG